MWYLYFLSDLAFSDHKMKKGHDRIMVESESYCRLSVVFIFSDIFTWCIESLDEYQDGIESTGLNLGWNRYSHPPTLVSAKFLWLPLWNKNSFTRSDSTRIITNTYFVPTKNIQWIWGVVRLPWQNLFSIHYCVYTVTCVSQQWYINGLCKYWLILSPMNPRKPCHSLCIWQLGSQ